MKQRSEIFETMRIDKTGSASSGQKKRSRKTAFICGSKATVYSAASAVAG